jgi:hypothetical protein
MTSPCKIVLLSTYQKPQGEFSHASKNGEKIALPGDSEKIAESPENQGVSAVPETPLNWNSGEQPGATNSPKKKNLQAKPTKPTKNPKQKSHALPAAAMQSHLSSAALIGAPCATTSHQSVAAPHSATVSHFSSVLPSSSVESDCAALAAGQLHAKYKGPYQSWKNGKFRCKTKGWPWAVEWDTFKGFLKTMPEGYALGCTLDRIDNNIHAYGPGLCRWATAEVQNNNKGNNIKIVEPLTGKLWTAAMLAKQHKVKVKTLYKRRHDGWHDYELLWGKRAPHLHSFLVLLDALPAPTAKKPTVLSNEIAYNPPNYKGAPATYREVIRIFTGADPGPSSPKQLSKDAADLADSKRSYARELAEYNRTYTAKTHKAPPAAEPAHPFCIEPDDDFDPADCDPGDECDPND